MFKKILSIIISLAAICSFSIPVFAEESTSITNETDNEEIIESIGLIDDVLLECSVGTKQIHIRMKTTGAYAMDEIGFTDIQIQRYTSSGWYTEKSISSVTITNAYSYYLSDYTTSVLGGYSYRVVLNHYARDGSLYEKVGDTSNSVWIS